MSFRRALWALAVVVCLAAPIAVQAQGDYLDVFVVKVKPEKLADFQALTKKWADANRRFNGDRWLALEAVYGEGNVYQFTSTRKDYADIDKTNEAVMAAVNKAFGKEAGQKMEQDFNNCLVWSRSELRRRRWDLSRKAPQGSEAYAKFIGESRLLRFVPDLSNPPDEIAKVAVDFWRPKAVMAAASKPKDSMQPAAVKEAVKKP